MILIYFFIILLCYSLTPGNNYIVPQSTYVFSHTFYSSINGSNCNNIQPPQPLSCNLNVKDGQSVKIFNGNCNWIQVGSCNNIGSNNYIKTFRCTISITASGLKAGEGRADLNCSQGYSSSSTPLLFDFENPNIYDVSYQPQSPFYQDSVEVNFCVKDDNSDILCDIKLNGIVLFNRSFSSNQGCSNFEIRNLDWGTHLISIECRDKTRHPNWIGIKRKSGHDITVQRYTSQTAIVTLLSPQNLFATNNTTAKPVIVNFTVNNSPTEYVDCKIINLNTNAQIDAIDGVRNNSLISRNYTNFTDGVYNIRVECIDRGPRNIGRSSSTTFIVDRDAPIIEIIYPANGSLINSYPINFKAFIKDSVPTPNRLNCTMTIAGITYVTNTEPNKEINYIYQSPLNDGTYDFNVSCTDLAGNKNSSGVRFIYKDGVPPRINLIYPVGVNIDTDQTNFRFSVIESSSFNCQVIIEGPNNNQTRSVAGSGNQDITLNNVNTEKAGEYKWKVSCKDSNNNLAESAWASFRKISSFQTPSSGISCNSQQSNRMLNIFAVVAVIGILLIGLGYLFGNIFNNQEILLGAKAELRSYFVTIFLFGIIIFAANAFYCDYSNNILTQAKNNLSLLANKINNSLISLSKIYAMSTILSSISPLEWSLSIMIIELNKRENFNKKIYEYGNNALGVIKLFQTIIFNLSYYTRLVEFLINYSYNFLIYLAFIARVIPITKRIGSTLLGIAVSLIFILPLIYNISTVILVDLTLNVLNTLEDKIFQAEAALAKVYFPIADKLDMLNKIASLTALFELLWLLAKFVFWIFLQISKFVGITYPIAAYLFYVFGDLLYGIIKMIIAVLWSLEVNNLNILGTGGTNDVLESFDILLNYDSMVLLAFLNLINIVYYVTNIIVMIIAIRSISLLGGGDYFLYGIEERI